MKSNSGIMCLLVAGVLLSGCAQDDQAKLIPVAMPHGETATIVAHNQSVPDWMLSTDSLKLNFIVRGNVSDDQMKAVAAVETACRIYTKTVRPNDLVAVAIDGILYGAAGFIGTGTGAAVAFKGASFMDYGKYGGTATAANGAAGGLMQSGGKTYTFENCGQTTLSLFEKEYGVHVMMKSPF